MQLKVITSVVFVDDKGKETEIARREQEIANDSVVAAFAGAALVGPTPPPAIGVP